MNLFRYFFYLNSLFEIICMLSFILLINTVFTILGDISWYNGEYSKYDEAD